MLVSIRRVVTTSATRSLQTCNALRCPPRTAFSTKVPTETTITAEAGAPPPVTKGKRGRKPKTSVDPIMDEVTAHFEPNIRRGTKVKVKKDETQNMKAVKLLQPDAGDFHVGNSKVEKYFVVGVTDCPGIKFIQESVQKFEDRFPHAIFPDIHYCYYNAIQYDVRRIEILQQTRHLPHQLKTSPIVYASETNLILPEIISNGLDRGAWPHVFLGNHVNFIEHLATRIAKPDLYTSAQSVIKSLPRPNPYETLAVPEFNHWTAIVLKNNKDIIKKLPPQNHLFVFKKDLSIHTNLPLNQI